MKASTFVMENIWDPESLPWWSSITVTWIWLTPTSSCSKKEMQSKIITLCMTIWNRYIVNSPTLFTPNAKLILWLTVWILVLFILNNSPSYIPVGFPLKRKKFFSKIITENAYLSMMATNLSPSPSVIQRLVNEVYQLPSLFNVVNSYLLW